MTSNEQMGEDELIGPWVDGGLGIADVLAGLLRACPTLVDPFSRHLESWGDRPRGVYNDTPVVASHMVDLLMTGQLAEMNAGFVELERLLTLANREARAALIVGVIEEMQNVAQNRKVDPLGFRPFMKPETTAAWGRVRRYWEASGATSLADLIRQQRGLPPSGAPLIDASRVENPELRMIVESLQRPPFAGLEVGPSPTQATEPQTPTGLRARLRIGRRRG
jgi:hypothetical protein